MCRSIKPLFNFEPQATDQEVYEASLQYIRKISGMTKPSEGNREFFDAAVLEVMNATKKLLNNLQTTSSPKSREIEAAKRKALFEKRSYTQN